MGKLDSTFNCQNKGSEARKTLEWLANHPEVKPKKPVRGYLAECVLAFRVYKIPGADYGFVLIVRDEMVESALRQYEALLKRVIQEGYRAQFTGREITQFSIETTKLP